MAYYLIQMIAEFELLHFPKSRKERKIARDARPIFETLNLGLHEADNGLTIRPSGLFALIGKSSMRFLADKEKGLYDFICELDQTKLQKRLKNLRSLNRDQKDTLLYAVAPRFAELVDASVEHFVKGYEFFAAMHILQADSVNTKWPIDVEDMFLDGIMLDELTNLMTNLAIKTHMDQPYMAAFVTGASYEYFLGLDGIMPKDIYETTYRERMVFSGIGLAMLHLENEMDECERYAEFYYQEEVTE